jgi:glycolate oxidase FAD binding subunit
MTVLEPATLADLVTAVRTTPRLIAVGAGTKPRLAAVAGDFVRLSTARLNGIVEYEPTEFTFTAQAGTPVRDIAATLAERGQYLPFDPLLAEAGATLGGTVAAGLSGPGRIRYGGLRDFIIGVRFVDGEGRVLRGGGKVVKNAAGFDLPKFFTGSAGRFGVLAEVSFKVFPQPVTTRTLRLEVDGPAARAKVLMEAAATRWEPSALEAPARENFVYLRLAGPPPALDALTAEVLGRWPGTTLADRDAEVLWRDVRAFGWAHATGTLVKIALTPGQIPDFEALFPNLPGARGWIGNGGNTGYLSLAPDATLPPLEWPALTLRGDAPLWPGARPRFAVMRAVKAALDPPNRFPDLDD